jgi:hypothetical protein
MPMIQPKFSLAELSIMSLTAANPLQSPGFLTPDALMAYCSTRLRGLDDQINSEMVKQQTANHDSSVLSKLQSDLGTPPQDLGISKSEPADGTGTDAKNWFYTRAQMMVDAAKDVTDPSVRAALLDAAQKLCPLNKSVDSEGHDVYTVIKDGRVGKGDGNYTNDGTVSLASFKAMTTERAAAVQKDLNSGTELAMINLQSLMSQRQSSVQTVTNMIQALGDQLNKIASNIGH